MVIFPIKSGVDKLHQFCKDGSISHSVEVLLVSLHSLFGFLLFNYVGEIGVIRSPIWSMCRRKMRIIGSKACNNCNIVGDGGVAWRGVRELDPRIGYYTYENRPLSDPVLSCPAVL